MSDGGPKCPSCGGDDVAIQGSSRSDSGHTPLQMWECRACRVILLIDQRSLLLDCREGGLGHQVTGGLRWLVTCSCGWGREASSEWAANAVSCLHRQLGDVGVEHVTHVEAPNDAKGGDQLTLVQAYTDGHPGVSRHARHSPEGEGPPSWGCPFGLSCLLDPEPCPSCSPPSTPSCRSTAGVASWIATWRKPGSG
jgi:hypothetical protein